MGDWYLIAECLDLTRFGCCCRIGREGSVVGKTAVCSLNTSSVWTDSEFGNSIVSVGTLSVVRKETHYAPQDGTDELTCEACNARVSTKEEAKEIAQYWLQHPFEWAERVMADQNALDVWDARN